MPKEKKFPYRFVSEQEPSEKQLDNIMKEVAIDVRNRAEATNEKFRQDLNKLSLAMRKQYGVAWKI